ncbi:MAG: hypothetical protein ABR881_15605 [Candidatus Sulfotelmatobacter sp.]|jgi:hypothetical protein
MMLRGAAFNGLIGFSLSVFAWGATLRHEKHGSWLRLALVPVPVLYFVVAFVATVHHFKNACPSDPPYMEFRLTLLGLVGTWLIWRRESPPKPEETRAKETGSAKETGTKCYWQKEHGARLVVLSTILTIAAVLGWWSTEVLRGEQVIYSYASSAAQK